ncbi:hypothetical protein BT63DRAFT_461074 [Microthyrium microscopicum]|uniref:Uncharacterized protein n=1 Tax=Microthyrium microscopicum TaxID=703497 RepID=A0A6A6TYM1_9PEZI|nr:hypothetical protein BT63DRAFT_461074 [Microthyrium microscopicum]
MATNTTANDRYGDPVTDDPGYRAKNIGLSVGLSVLILGCLIVIFLALWIPHYRQRRAQQLRDLSDSTHQGTIAPSGIMMRDLEAQPEPAQPELLAVPYQPRVRTPPPAYTSRANSVTSRKAPSYHSDSASEWSG